jgi:hypothetical protein
MAHDPIREAIKEAYEKASGNAEEAERFLREDNRVKFLSPVMIFAIIYYAIAIWKLWNLKGVKTPTDDNFTLLGS